EENEEIADWLVETHGMEPVGVATDRQWGIKETRSPAHCCPGYRFYPNSVQGEGFFLAVFRKPRHLETSVSRPKTKIEKNVVEPGRLSGWLEFPSEFFNFLVGDTLHVF